MKPSLRSPKHAHRLVLTLFAVVPLLAGGCAGSNQGSIEATVAALAPQVSGAAGAAATAQVQAGAAVLQAATAQEGVESVVSQAATARSLAETAVAPTLATATPVSALPSPGAAFFPIRRGLSITTRSGSSVGAVVYPVDQVRVYRSLPDLVSDTSLERVELVFATVTTGTFTLRYNAQATGLSGSQPERWSGFSSAALITPRADGSLDPTSALQISEVLQGSITATAPFTQTLADGTVLSVEDITNQLIRDGVDLKRAYILLIKRDQGQVSHVLVTFFDPGGGAGGSLFEAWCQACVEGVCRVFCG
jgi:hypothetical protein